MSLSLGILLFLAQEADLASTLRQGGWKEVDRLGAKPELRSKLADLASGNDAELAWWAGAALAELQAREKAGDAWTPPLQVTLQAKEKGVGHIFRQLLERTKVRPPDFPEGERPITVAFRDAPILEAIDEVCRQAGLVLTRDRGGRLQTAAGEPPRGPRFYHAGFAAAAVSLVRRTEVTFREEPASQLHLTLSIEAEPGIKILEDEDAGFVLVSAKDDSGRSLLKEGPGTVEPRKAPLNVRAPFGGTMVQATLAVPAEGARKIALVRGVATLTVARKIEEIVFDHLAKAGPQARESGGVKASLTKITREGEETRLELELSAREPAHWPEVSSMNLENADGRTYPRWGSSMNSSGSGASYQITYRDREGLGDPEKFRIFVVTATYPRKVYFEFRDIGLQ